MTLGGITLSCVGYLVRILNADLISFGLRLQALDLLLVAFNEATRRAKSLLLIHRYIRGWIHL